MKACPEDCWVCEEHDDVQSPCCYAAEIPHREHVCQECKDLLAAPPEAVGHRSPGSYPRAGAEGARAPAGASMPPCGMFLDAESLNHVTGASVLGWRAGGALLGCIAGMDASRRVLLVIEAGDSNLFADLVAYHGPRADERPKTRRDHWSSPGSRRQEM